MIFKLCNEVNKMKAAYLQNSIHFLVGGYKSDCYQLTVLTEKSTKQNPHSKPLQYMAVEEILEMQ